jgi:hypothetical protein
VAQQPIRRQPDNLVSMLFAGSRAGTIIVVQIQLTGLSFHHSEIVGSNNASPAAQWRTHRGHFLSGHCRPAGKAGL